MERLTYQIAGLILWLLFFAATSIEAQYSEAEFARLIQLELGGAVEKNINGGRIDILTDAYAIEVEFAAKWKNSIGQALWYGLQTNKQPGIVLIKKSLKDNRYVLRLGSALDYADLSDKVKVWVWPDDFDQHNRTRSGRFASPNRNLPNEGQYWLTSSSKTRHNADCQYFKKSTGAYCDKQDGTACGICGG